jgi:hypothetical protein
MACLLLCCDSANCCGSASAAAERQPTSMILNAPAIVVMYPHIVCTVKLAGKRLG